LNYRIRLVAGLLLLLAAGYSVWQTISILSSRRLLRTELAEIGHVRYGVLNADRWVAKLLPILGAQIDALDLTASNRAGLKPTVVKALNSLLDQVQKQLAPTPPPGADFMIQMQSTMVANMLLGLRPHVPEYADMVLKELGKPENKQAVKDYIRSMATDGAKTTFGAVDMTWYSQILKQNGCADAVACQGVLGNRIRALDSQAAFHCILVLVSSGLAFLLLGTGRAAIAVQLLFCIALLFGGLLTPMLEVEAKISQISLTFFGQPIAFGEQVLYYQSKSVLEVFKTLVTMDQPEMVLVGVLVLMFSVIFPALKVIAVGCCLHDPSLVERNRVVRFFALESSKWSMADVMALAIFMSFVAFNGIIGSAMGGLQGHGVALVLPTDSSRILPGFYLFIGFVLASLWLGKKLERAIATASSAPTSSSPSH
jgi:Paraquat-inducible protein A